MRTFYLFFFLLMVPKLYGTPIAVSFLDQPYLEQFSGKEILIRGFLYETKDHDFILSGEPNIKSCCIEKNELFKIHVFGLLKKDLAQNALTIEGKLYISKEKSGFKRYELKNARLHVENKESLSNTLLLITLLIAILMSFYIFNRSTKEYRSKA